MNTLITWNQLREMEEATQNRFNRFLGGFPNRIGTGETHSLTVPDWSPEVDISQDNHEYLLKAGLPRRSSHNLQLQMQLPNNIESESVTRRSYASGWPTLSL